MQVEIGSTGCIHRLVALLEDGTPSAVQTAADALASLACCAQNQARLLFLRLTLAIFDAAQESVWARTGMQKIICDYPCSYYAHAYAHLRVCLHARSCTLTYTYLLIEKCTHGHTPPHLPFQ